MKTNSKTMKTSLFLASIFLLASSSAFAVDPITPDNETSKISIHEDVFVTGSQDSYTKTEKHSMNYASPNTITVNVDGEDVFSDSLKKAMINYTNDINAINGETHVVEDFAYDLSSNKVMPNLKTTSHINFQGASLSKTEKAETGISELKGLSYSIDGNDNICINKNGACWDAAVGSSMNVSYVESSSQIDLDITHKPYIHNMIAASGTGSIKSGMNAIFKEGLQNIYAKGNCPSASSSVTSMQYDTHTYANGQFKFSKDVKNVINNLNANKPTDNIDKVP